MMISPLSAVDTARIQTLIRRGAWHDAQAAIVAALQRIGANPWLLIQLAATTEKLNSLDAALGNYAQASSMAPDDPTVQEAFADALDRAGRARDGCVVRFTFFMRGGRDIDLLAKLSAYLFDSGLSLNGDQVYGGAFFARLMMQAASHPLQAVLPLVNRYWNGPYGRRAVQLVKDCLAFMPADFAIWRTLGSLSYFGNDLDTGSRALGRAVTLNGDAYSRVMSALAIGLVMSSTDEIRTARARVEAAIDALIADPDLSIDLVTGTNSIVINLFNFAYHGIDDRPLMEKIGRMFRQADPGLTWRAPHLDREKKREEPVRVALVGSLEIDSVSRMLQFLPAALPPEKYALTYFTAVDPRPEIKAAFPGEWVMLPPGIGDAREVVASYRLDIVMFTDLFMNWFFYFLAFSRLARVQCLWPGHPDTSGLDTIDYYISTDMIERPDAAEDYSEDLILLPDLCTVYPRLPVKTVEFVVTEFGIPAEANIYLCVQTLFKIHPDFDPMLQQILDRDPNACLIFFESSHPEHTKALGPRFQAAFARYEGRVRILPRMPLEVFLGLVRTAKVVLDTPHFCGGNTSLQTIQLNVPLVTLPGRFQRGRGTYSIYRIMGFEDLVARDADDYVRIAIQVATDPAFRARCVQEIAARQHRLFDREDIGAAYAALFAQWAGAA